MANLGYTFDSSQVEPAGEFPVIPAGEYLVQAVKSEMKATKDGTGQRLNIEFDILEGEHKGKKLFEGLNVLNAGPKAEITMEIAHRQLSSFWRATCAPPSNDTEVTHFIPVIANVIVKPAEGNYGPKNEIRSYKPVGVASSAPAASTPGASASAPAASAGASTPPWKRRAA